MLQHGIEASHDIFCSSLFLASFWPFLHQTAAKDFPLFFSFVSLEAFSKKLITFSD